MSDRTAASLFAQIFAYLARKPDLNREFAHTVWVRTMDYDFDPYQMSADDELIELGLARVTEEGIEYGPADVAK